jgi:RNA polymerase sigma-70 factor (ECF subfamily)
MPYRERLLDELRPASFAIADRMLGGVSGAEDVVQEALLPVHQALEAGEQIASPRAFVAAVTTGWRSTSSVRRGPAANATLASGYPSRS